MSETSINVGIDVSRTLWMQRCLPARLQQAMMSILALVEQLRDFSLNASCWRPPAATNALVAELA